MNAGHSTGRHSGRRHRGRFGLAAGAAAMITLTACSGSGSPRPAPTLSVRTGTGVHVQSRLDGAVQLVADHRPAATAPPNAATQGDTAAVVRAEQALTVRLLGLSAGSGNVSVSPLSLFVALGMLRNGASGTTDTQIATALQSPHLTPAAENGGIDALMTQLDRAAADDHITLQSANSIWQQAGSAPRADFLATLATYYRAGVWQTDFREPAGARAINAWTSQQTHGLITKLFDKLDPQTLLVLANAIYFHADWAESFDPNATVQGTFTTGDGTQVRADYMSGRAGLQAKVGGDYDVVQLPYTGSRFAALAVMPLHGSLPDFVRGLTPTTLAGLGTGLTTGTTSVSLPKFTTTSSTALKQPLQMLGMRQAFTDAADFSRLGATPTKVAQVQQRVYLGVGEKGTTAAAVTGISMQPSGAVAGPSVTLDHPFLFLVRDTTTGAVLFASTIDDPTGG